MATKTKKKTTKRRASKKQSTEPYQTFKVAPDFPPILTFKVTKQTIYWVFLMAIVIFLQLLIIKTLLETAQVIQNQQDTVLFQD